MAQGIEFIGMTEDGRYQYIKTNGKVFVSKRNLHEKNEIEIIDQPKKISEILSKDEIEETEVDELANAFGKNVGKGSNKHPASTLKDVFGEALKDVSDKNVSEQQVQDQTLKIIAKLEQAGIIFQVENNKKLQKNVLLNAEEKLMNEIEVSKNRQNKRLQDATYEANEFAANIYGIDSGRPKWQLLLARSGANVFFMIWFIVSSVTFTPIMFFLGMIGVQVKSSPLKWLFTILIYIGLLILIWVIVANIAGYENIGVWPNKPPVAG